MTNLCVISKFIDESIEINDNTDVNYEQHRAKVIRLGFGGAARHTDTWTGGEGTGGWGAYE